MEFKIGDKVKIPTQSTANIGDYKQACNQMAGYELDYLVITDLNTCKNPNWEVGLDMDSGKTLFANAFNFIDIELYEEKKETTMKNLLETEFVIENCSLGQRAAIKHYCEEKGIKQLDLETPKFNVVTFSNRQFKCFLTSSVPRNKITFSELIQFLDKYQPEPEFKVGDKVYIIETSLGWIERGDIVELGGKYWENYGIKKENEKNHFSCKTIENPEGNSGLGITKFRHATPEEIKKWKEENEIKLPKIADYSGEQSIGYLKWGCTSISISTIKELLALKTNSITIGNVHLDNILIQQIKKFIEHNKL